MFMCVLSLRVKHLVMFWFGERGGIKGENVAGEKVRTGRGDGGTIYLFMWFLYTLRESLFQTLSHSLPSDLQNSLIYGSSLYLLFLMKNLWYYICLCVHMDMFQILQWFLGKPFHICGCFREDERKRMACVPWQRWPVSPSYPFSLLLCNTSL